MQGQSCYRVLYYLLFLFSVLMICECKNSSSGTPEIVYSNRDLDEAKLDGDTVKAISVAINK